MTVTKKVTIIIFSKPLVTSPIPALFAAVFPPPGPVQTPCTKDFFASIPLCLYNRNLQ